MKDNKLTPKDFKRFGISSSQASQWIKKYYSGRSSKAVKVVCQFHPNKEWYWWTKGDKHSRAAYLQKLIDNHPDSVTKPVAEH